MIGAEDKRNGPMYIHSELDDLGLDPYAFRVYARLVRRAGTPKGAFESVDEMAKGCHMSARQVHKALRELEKRHLVEKEGRKGQTSVYHITDKTAWQTSAPHADPPTSAHDADPPLHDVQTTPAPRADKGTQPKASKKKEPPSSPPILRLERRAMVRQAGRAPDFTDLLHVYNEYRGELPEAKKLTRKRRQGLARLVDEVGNDEVTDYLRDATQQVAGESYWIEQQYNFDNLLVSGRVVEKAEKHRASKTQWSRADRKLAASFQEITAAIGGGS